MTLRVCESHVEKAAPTWFKELSWSILHVLETATGDLQ